MGSHEVPKKGIYTKPNFRRIFNSKELFYCLKTMMIVLWAGDERMRFG